MKIRDFNWLLAAVFISGIAFWVIAGWMVCR